MMWLRLTCVGGEPGGGSLGGEGLGAVWQQGVQVSHMGVLHRHVVGLKTHNKYWGQKSVVFISFWKKSERNKNKHKIWFIFIFTTNSEIWEFYRFLFFSCKNVFWFWKTTTFEKNLKKHKNTNVKNYNFLSRNVIFLRILEPFFEENYFSRKIKSSKISECKIWYDFPPKNNEIRNKK